MKAFNITFLFICVVGLSSSFAQFGKGTWMVGGSASAEYNSTSYNYSSGNYIFKQKNFSSTFLPAAGYFVVDNFAIGLGIGQYGSYSHATNSPNQHSSSIIYSTFARYYHKNFFGQISGNIGTGSVVEVPDDVVSFSTKTYGYGLGIGYAWLLNKSIAIEPMIGYSHQTQTQSEQDGKTINPGFFLQFGFQVYLNRH